jgi:hypothetical protein
MRSTLPNGAVEGHTWEGDNSYPFNITLTTFELADSGMTGSYSVQAYYNNAFSNQLVAEMDFNVVC